MVGLLSTGPTPSNYYVTMHSKSGSMRTEHKWSVKLDMIKQN